jgi:ribosomal protein S18 acetylase RimI-like enzyme
MPEIIIRPATSDDIISLVDIDHSFRTHYAWQMDLSQDAGQINVNFREIRLPRPITVDYPRQPKNLLNDWAGRSVLLVGILERQVVGYISVSEDVSPTTAWITDIAISPTARRQGIASALILAAEDWAKKRNNRRMILEMQSKNTPAIRMAFKLGFEFCGYNDHYYTNQDIALFFAQFLRSVK